MQDVDPPIHHHLPTQSTHCEVPSIARLKPVDRTSLVDLNTRGTFYGHPRITTPTLYKHINKGIQYMPNMKTPVLHSLKE